MIRIQLSGDDNVLLLSPRWNALAPGAQFAVIGLALLVPVALIVWLYRHELGLVSRRAAGLLLGLRLVVIVLLWIVAVWQPVVVHEYTEELPSRVLIAVDRSGSMSVRDPQRTVVEKLRLARALDLVDPAAAPLLASWIALFEQ